MTIILFGIYSKEPEYPRQRNLIAGLKASGAQVYECHFTMASNFQERFHSATTVLGMLSFLAGLFGSYISLSRQYLKAPKADAILVLYPGYFHVRLLQFLRLFKNRKAAMLYDVFFSLYDALVLDRRVVRKSTWAARLVFRLDRNAGKTANAVLIDTDSHALYISRLLDIPPENFHRVFVGSTFSPFPESKFHNDDKDRFTILFIGTYIPLHGVQTILSAAKELQGEQEVHFLFVGMGQLRTLIENMATEWGLSKVRFRDWVPAAEIGELLRSCALALGIFGITEKARRVIPIKVFDICAAGVPFITADTPAIREVFTHGENAYLVPPGEPKALAEAIRKLKGDMELRERIARGAHLLAQTVFCREAIGGEIIKIIDAKEHHQKEHTDKTY